MKLRSTDGGPETASLGRKKRTGAFDASGAAGRVHDVGIAADAPILARDATVNPHSDVQIEDWDGLLAAFKAMLLRLNDGENADSAAARHGHEASGRIRDRVLECVAALDHLHTTLQRELGHRGQLEREVSNARSALARAHRELAGSRAGERRARQLALHDGLTSLPNRRCFLERLEQALAQVGPRHPALAVLYLDLDDFKSINDLHGHVAGDELLRIVAARLSRAVRAEDVMSRLGGDEFACLVAKLRTREELGHLARKLLDAVSSPLMIGPLALSVRPSIGIATYPADGATAEALLKSADGAMYHAKRHRKGFAFCDPQFRNESRVAALFSKI
ncbi:MAG: GGDEF domain-containing protein [Gammaproteobacteria bacterium]|nr:GGDEF domain-containing protein [Gammaproteobacteria bacterium]